MAIAGRVAIVPKGDWSADAAYKRLDAVTYNNTLYFAKKEVPVGTATSNTEYWSKSIVGGVGAIATKEDAGIVKPADGLSIAEDGTLKVSIDGTTLTMDQVNNVIKLADALKDKIGSALQPESIVNNLTTTEAGFALDARQANPNVEGTLAKQISDLNGSLNDLNNFKFRKFIDNWSSSSQVSGGCGIYKINTIEDKFYNLISKNVTTFKNVGDYTLIIFSWNGLETLNYSSGLLTTPRSTTFCFVQVWDGDFILYDV
jgi:hypothetical protein